MRAVIVWWRILLVLVRQASGRWFILRDERLDVIVKLIAVTAHMKEPWAEHLNQAALDELTARLDAVVRASETLNEAERHPMSMYASSADRQAAIEAEASTLKKATP